MRAAVVLVIAVALTGCVAHAHPRAALDPTLEAANAARLDDAIRRAAERLRALAHPDGRFVYAYRVDDGSESDQYNIVRHAGAIYALAAYERVAPDPRTRAVIASTSAYLVTHAVRALDHHEGAPAETSAVFSMSAGDALDDDAVLGATGLGVVALVAAETLAPDSIGAPTLHALGNFLLYMQRPDGGFFTTYTRDGGRSDDNASLYYPGEAILALALLHAWDHDPRWLDGALRGLRHLAAVRVGSHDVPSDNWALIATAELVRQGGMSADDRTRFAHHADQIATTNLDTQIIDPQAPLFGCYTDDGATTPTSTHLEGLLAAATFLPRPELRASIDAGIHFLLASQLPDGALPGDQRKRLVRIDFIQHALSAFLGAHALAAP